MKIEEVVEKAELTEEDVKPMAKRKLEYLGYYMDQVVGKAARQLNTDDLMKTGLNLHDAHAIIAAIPTAPGASLLMQVGILGAERLALHISLNCGLCCAIGIHCWIQGITCTLQI